MIARKDEHYIQGKWVECKTAILRQEMEQKYGQTAPPKKGRGSEMQDHEYFEESSSGYYSPSYPSYKAGPMSPNPENYPETTPEYYRNQFNQIYSEDYYRPRESRPRRADQFARQQQAGRNAPGNYLYSGQGGYDEFYQNSPISRQQGYQEVLKPTYVQSHRVHRGIPSNFGGNYDMGSDADPMNLPMQVNTSPSPKGANQPSRSPVRPFPVPPQTNIQHPMVIGSPVRPSSPLQAQAPPMIPSPPRSSQSPVRPIPVPPQIDVEEEQDEFRAPQAPQNPNGYQMFGRMPSPTRESTSGQYFSLYGTLAQKEVSSSRNSPKLAEYKKYYSPTQKVRNDGYSKLYERVFHLKPEDKSSK